MGHRARLLCLVEIAKQQEPYMFAISEALFLMVILSWVTKELLCIKQVLK